MKLDIDVRTERAGTCVVAVDGSIDLDSRTSLREAADRTLDTAGLTSLVLDLSGVQFMDSTGIGTLVDIASHADEQGIGFAIRDPSRRVQRVLEITGLAEHWSIGPDRSRNKLPDPNVRRVPRVRERRRRAERRDQRVRGRPGSPQ